ncbi:FAD-dependent monooxygenase [Spirillospora sp. CA-142024]|uniref:FAD-dependent monooxygenase n=1 Tax=Spirillospora sp. CA-142024 TaxID=3240036 RepID=UPI003D8C0F4D
MDIDLTGRTASVSSSTQGIGRVEVVGLDQDEDGVALHTGDTAPIRCRFAVGCDGGASAVRKLAGIGFPGLPPTRVLRLADFTVPAGVAQDDHLALPGGGRIPFFRGGVVPLGEGVFRVITNEPFPPGLDRDAPMTVGELHDSVRRTVGVDLPISTARWVSRFTDSSRQADRYRAHRVLLAGDAAHVHLPAGGPGLNTGLQDAANLGWKLAAEVRGRAPEGLLDTYHSERHAEGARVMMHTRAQGALTIEDGRVGALRDLLGELLTDPETTRRIAALVYAMDTRYDMGIDDDLPVGRWAPDVMTQDGGRLAEHMHRARPLLVGAKCPGWEDRVDTVEADSTEPMLVRPDGYVAWAGGGNLREALTRWFGPPA